MLQVSIMSLIPNGTPCSGPLCPRRSRARACAITWSALRYCQACTVGSRSAIWLRQARATASQVVCPLRVACTTSVAVRVWSACINPDVLMLGSLLQVCLSHAARTCGASGSMHQSASHGKGQRVYQGSLLRTSALCTRKPLTFTTGGCTPLEEARWQDRIQREDRHSAGQGRTPGGMGRCRRGHGKVLCTRLDGWSPCGAPDGRAGGSLSRLWPTRSRRRAPHAPRAPPRHARGEGGRQRGDGGLQAGVFARAARRHRSHARSSIQSHWPIL